ncbi:hypothetical protein [Occallatibacter savannae]|uniref:hypothetical protein n=1 Tax=Occallatibacter savannae TaxID=1002691 RepID=UPI000D694B89|nr:hypothetical protein [Occallatibacter savannae]
MKQVTSIMSGILLAFVIAGGSGGARANAQDGTGEIFTVPFAFTVDGHDIQPGTYEVRRDLSPFLLSVENVKTGEKELFSVRPEQRRAIPAKGLLVFQRCGDRNKLSEFHVPGTNLYSATIDARPRKSTEVESCSRAETMTIAAR